jgi:hypothetical protein
MVLYIYENTYTQAGYAMRIHDEEFIDASHASLRLPIRITPFNKRKKEGNGP